MKQLVNNSPNRLTLFKLFSSLVRDSVQQRKLFSVLRSPSFSLVKAGMHAPGLKKLLTQMANIQHDWQEHNGQFPL